MKFDLTNPQINLIKRIVERLYNQLNKYKIYLEVEFTFQDGYNQKISQEELKRIDSLKVSINHLET